MKTELLTVNPAFPEPDRIARAAAVLRRGGLVAFPTETVYGLGAAALDARAVRRIFEAKGRPSHNPVIVHVADADAARTVAADWPESARALAERFWPGPLTLVVPRGPAVPDEVTAGGPTVALRVPDHPVALALIRAAGVPVAAPSANLSTSVSPTRAVHVLRTLDGRIDMVLDGGPCAGGIESTVLALPRDGAPRILRPGLITRAQIEAVLGRSVLAPSGAPEAGASAPSPENTAAVAPLPSPGMLERHYAPRAPLVIAAGDGRTAARTFADQGLRTGWLAFEDENRAGLPASVRVEVMPRDPAGYAARLYAALHDLDALPVDRIVASRLPDTDDWTALRDRLKRAAVPR